VLEASWGREGPKAPADGLQNLGKGLPQEEVSDQVEPRRCARLRWKGALSASDSHHGAGGGKVAHSFFWLGGIPWHGHSPIFLSTHQPVLSELLEVFHCNE
jgi:hypothetical protein